MTHRQRPRPFVFFWPVRAAHAALLAGLLALGACTAPGGPPAAAAATSSQPALTAPSPEVRAALAPTGTLRIAVYPGSPTSMVPGANGQPPMGVTVEIGQALARALGVPAQLHERPRVAEVVAALQRGEADITITNATPDRFALLNFTPPLVALELGVLVPGPSRWQGVDDIDQPGARIGVSQGSSSERALRARLKQAQLLTLPTLADAAAAMREGRLDGFATNKGILNELAEQVPASRLLSGRWGLEHLALGTGKGREVAMPWLRHFAAHMAATGQVQAAAERARLRGTVPAEAGNGVEVVWLGQSAFKITTPGGKVIVTDPWLRANPLTPPDYKKLETFGKIDVLLVTHGHADHFADAPALAQLYDTPIRAPGDLNQTATTLGLLPARLLPRMNKGGTVTAAPGIQITAVRAEHSSILVWHNPASDKDETHPGGEPIGWIITLENGFRIYHAGDTAVFADMAWIGQRYQPDLALVPIGGHFTMDPTDAAYAVKELIRPKAVMPMHYGANPLAKGTAQQFIDALGPQPGMRVIVPKPGQVVSF